MPARARPRRRRGTATPTSSSGGAVGRRAARPGRSSSARTTSPPDGPGAEDGDAQPGAAHRRGAGGSRHRPNGSRREPAERPPGERRRSATLASHDDRPRPRARAASPRRRARPRIFCGIQPSGVVHLGNDLGAIRNYVRLQGEYEAIYCIVDYHALTSTHDAGPAAAADARDGRLAAGPRASTRSAARCSSRATAPSTPSWPGCSRRSRRSAGSSGRRRTRRRSANQPDDVNHGLLTYPVLQAADIVIYKASLRAGRQGPGRPPRAVARDRPGVQRAATARRSPSRRRSTPRRRSSSAPTASGR